MYIKYIYFGIAVFNNAYIVMYQFVKYKKKHYRARK